MAILGGQVNPGQEIGNKDFIEKQVPLNQKRKKVLEDAGVPISDYVKATIREFGPLTKQYAKEYDKAARKKNKKQAYQPYGSKAALKVAKDKIIPVWEKVVAKDDETLLSLKEVFDKDEYAAYISLIYINVHSRTLSAYVEHILDWLYLEIITKAIQKAGEIDASEKA